MAFTTLYENTYTISNSEKSLTTGSAYSGSALQSTDNDLWIYLDTSDMAANDSGLIRIYEKVVSSGSAVLVYEYSITKGFVPPVNFAAIGNGWDVVAIRIGGADFDLAFSLRDQTAGSGATAAQVWDYLTSSISTSGSIGKLLKDNIDAAISSRLASASYTAPPSAASNASAVRTELSTELGRIDTTVSSRLASASYTAPLDAAGTRTAIGLASANLDTQLADIPTVAELASEINSVQSDIAALNDLSASDVAGAVWNAATGDYTTPETLGGEMNDLMLDVIEIKAKTDQLTFTKANELDVNAKSMNGATVNGNGTEGNLWRGA